MVALNIFGLTVGEIGEDLKPLYNSEFQNAT